MARSGSTSLPINIAVGNAVAHSSLPHELRYFLMMIAHLADHKTGAGYSSQATIAARMGLCERQVKRYFSDVAALGDACPVRITRKHRSRADGRGRSSDMYCLEVVQGDAGVPLNGDSMGRGCPVETASDGTTKGTSVQDQRDIYARPKGHPCPTIHICDPSQLDPCLSSTPKKSARGKVARSVSSKAKKQKAPKAESQPVAGAHELKLHYVAEFEATRGATPEFGKQWSRAMKDFGELVTTHGLDLAKTICSNALRDEYTRRINPWELIADANKHIGSRPGPARTRQQVQMGATAGWTADESLPWAKPEKWGPGCGNGPQPNDPDNRWHPDQSQVIE